MKVFEVDSKCKSCGATGVYSGMAERNGAAVVCHTCNGTGCHKIKVDYEEFSGKQETDKVKRVYEANPGICIGEGGDHLLEDFGGMPYKDWYIGHPFPHNSENREYTCPCWWYQSVDYKKKPDWDECNNSLGRSFSQCPNFGTKHKCWVRFDSENRQNI